MKNRVSYLSDDEVEFIGKVEQSLSHVRLHLIRDGLDLQANGEEMIDDAVSESGTNAFLVGEHESFSGGLLAGPMLGDYQDSIGCQLDDDPSVLKFMKHRCASGGHRIER